MKQNKGIIGLGLIVAIVLGVVVVGGGAYYLGNNNSKKELNNPVVNTDENLPSEKNKVIENVSNDNEVKDLVKAVTLDTSSELARTYKTAFTNALKQPANFNGHYSVASYGCGAGIMCYGIVDKLNGKVYSAPADDYNNSSGYSGDENFNKTRWSVNSNIFKSIGYTSIDTFKFENEKFTKIKSDPFPINPATIKSEESSTETFKNQPGAIKSIKADGTNKWVIAIDLLSSNPKWIPGVDSTGGFFINQNTKIRNLSISSATKIQNCTTQYNDYASGFENNLSSFITYVNKKISNPKEVGEFGYTAYFDISGTNVTTIYEQCLP